MDGKKLSKNVLRMGILMGSCLWSSILWAQDSDEDKTQSNFIEIMPELVGTLYGALLQGDEKTALELVRQGANVDMKNSEGQTYLYCFSG
jgi:hypothetical protein